MVIPFFTCKSYFFQDVRVSKRDFTKMEMERKFRNKKGCPICVQLKFQDGTSNMTGTTIFFIKSYVKQRNQSKMIGLGIILERLRICGSVIMSGHPSRSVLSYLVLSHSWSRISVPYGNAFPYRTFQFLFGNETRWDWNENFRNPNWDKFLLNKYFIYII